MKPAIDLSDLPLPQEGFIIALCAEGPGAGTWFERPLPAVGAMASTVWWDKETKRSHLYSAKFGGGGYLLLHYRGLIPADLCPLQRQLMGTDE